MKEILSSDTITNVDLRIKYLERVTEFSKEPDLLRVLAESYLMKGEYYKAIRVAETLSNYKNKEIEAIMLIYRIKKTSFFALKEDEERRAVLSDIRKTLYTLANKSEDIEILKFVYREGISMNLPGVSLYAAQKIAKKTGDSNWVEKVVELAVSMGEYSVALPFIDILGEESKKGALLKYRTLLETENYGEALGVLTKLLQKYPDLRDKYINDILWLSVKVKRDVGFLLLSLIEEARGEKRKALIKLAVNYALGRKNVNLAKRIIKKYATAYVEDIEFTSFMVKSALATGDSAFAGNIAEKVAKKMGLLNG
ncbi:hypothetical protein [Hydrogenivirga caldilitoris]|nr:hypothetical protein [Hydrogenivirga caldilitoris]